MPIDFDKTYNTVHAIQTKVGELLQIVLLAREAKVTVGLVGDFEFTAEQKTALRGKYDTLKAEMISLFQTLPE